MGFGTNTPGYPLHVHGPFVEQGDFLVYNGSKTNIYATGNGVQISPNQTSGSLRVGSSGNKNLFYDGSANILTIGNGSGTTKFQVTGTTGNVDVNGHLYADNLIITNAGSIGGNATVGLSLSADSGTITNKLTNSMLTASKLVLTDGNKAFSSSTLTDSDLVPTTRTITIAGTANQITSSAGAQDLSANRTWTLSTPQNIDIAAAVQFGSARIDGVGSFNGLVSQDSARITNAASVGGALTVGGLASMDSQRTTNAARFDGNLSAGSSVFLNSATVTNNLTGLGTLNISGSSSQAGGTFSGTLGVSGAATFGSSLNADNINATNGYKVNNVTLSTTNLGDVATSYSSRANNDVLTWNSTHGKWTNAPSASAGLADPGANGVVVRTSSGVTTARTITGTANQVSVSNGDGVSGNPTLSTPQSIDTAATVQFGSLGLGVATANSRKLSIEVDALGTTPTNGIILTNTTAAASNAQQYSPALEMVGNGWKTTATAASQPVAFRQYVVPVQGSANPTANWTLESAVNGGAFGNGMTYSSAGNLTTVGSITGGAGSFSSVVTSGAMTSGGNVTSGNNSANIDFMTSNGSRLRPVADGAWQALDFAATKIASIQYGITNVTKTANYTLVALDSGKYLNNIGASGAVTNTLPTAVAGMQFNFYIDAAQILCVQAVGSDTIRYGATVSAAAGNIYGSAVGSTLHLFSPASGKWIIDQLVGTFTGPQ
jgi:hypothetical protein